VTETIAFTGARRLAPADVDVVLAVVAALPDGIRVLHGACVGADALVGRAAYERGLGVHAILPALDEYTHVQWARYCHSHEQLAPSPEPYRARNQRLVALCDRLIAFPAWPEVDGRSRRSGTWMTIRLARAAGRPVAIHLLHAEGSPALMLENDAQRGTY
jgi:predicted Rossmann fold nucleotide-binding protein DprA/Smf involved in DNA uptake